MDISKTSLLDEFLSKIEKVVKLDLDQTNTIDNILYDLYDEAYSRGWEDKEAE